MNRFFSIICYWSFLLLFLTGHLVAQDKVALEKEKKKLLADLELTQKMLEEISQNSKNSVSQLNTLNKQIELRQRYIRAINKEINNLDADISETQGVIMALDKDMGLLKDEYGKMLRASYRKRSFLNQVLFLFSSRDFNDAIRRYKLLRTLSRYRHTQARMIEQTVKTLLFKQEDLTAKRQLKESLLSDQLGQKKELDVTKLQQNKLVDDLKKQERKLRQEVKRKQESAQKLSSKIEEIIKKEIAEAKRKAEEANKTIVASTETGTVTKTPVYASAPEIAKLTADFSGNMGKLPWPVENGIITGTFGTHQHPVLKLVQTVNNGVDIQTYENAPVKTIFNGEVVSVFFNPGFQKAVLIKHGEYFTTYSNLKEVSVKVGDKVSAHQNIGTVFTNKNESKTEVHLEIWKGTTILNPSLWISAR